MNPLIWALLISSLSTSTIITMSSHHWLLAWLGLELNTLSILPIITKPHSPRATEAATKYFIVQATAAALILFASTFNAWKTGQWTIIHSPLTTTNNIIIAAILLKMGVAPAHLWYPDVIQGSSMTTALVISTWQKFAPLSILYMTINYLPQSTLLVAGLISTLIGGLGGLNQTQTRKIMAFSSISHMGWLIISLMLNPKLTTLTLITYTILTTSMFLTLSVTKVKTILDMGMNWSYSTPMLATMMITLMSLGGLPPLTGFTPKMLILNNMMLPNLIIHSTILALTTLPSLFFYVRITYLTMLTIPPATTNTQHNWRLKPNLYASLTTIMMLSITLLPITPLLYQHL
uniref:NADH-ubiquinone oxidoreductase chain 2 n=1 Tax=Rhoptropus taeniostictus TaxID=152591 RepID=A0A1S6M3V5_9SAUR|nr:NADH dehydrogenase subunit 2 [Rhoptropus taeniostictus]